MKARLSRRALWPVVPYLQGLLLWGQFLNWGRIPFDFHDWAEINAPRLAFVQDAVRSGVLPLHMNSSSALRGLTDRFLCMPDPIISPQVLLLGVLDVGGFVLAHTWLLYTLGFAGLLGLRRRLRLSPPLFCALFLLLNFNGHILSHLAVGHVTWGGIFLFPWFIGLVLDLMDGETPPAWVVKTAFLLFAILLQGSYHHFIWCLMFLGLLGLVWPRRLPAVLGAGLFAGLLGAVRLLPPVLLLGRFDDEFLGGYPLARNILQALVVERLPEQAQPFMNFYSNLGYWEFSLYVGLAGAAFIAAGLGLWAWQQRNHPRRLLVFVPLALMAWFSIGDHYAWVSALPIPLLNGERVSSRMLILPLMVSMALAAGGWQAWLDGRGGLRRWLFPAAWAGSAWLAWDLGKHALRWQVTRAYAAFPHVALDLSRNRAANHPDPDYFLLAGLGAGISLLAGAALLLWLRRARRQ